MTATQRHWQDVVEGEALEALEFPLNVYRLVMAAGANRDFNSIHHNSDYARSTGAPDMYANSLFFRACGSAACAATSAMPASSGA